MTKPSRKFQHLGSAFLLSLLSLFHADRPLQSQSIALSPESQAALAALNIPVAVPTYIPEGFTLSQIKINLCSSDIPQGGECREGSSYEIIYRNADNVCVIIDAIGGGLGGPDSEFHYSIETPLLGEVEIGFGEIPGGRNTPTPEQLTNPQSRLYSFPAKATSTSSPYYAVRVPENRYACGSNTGISPLEVERILQSLVLLE
ncbi:hypothetical protein [Laspinema olomoucense]|uniref:hypothetical protein n=1 Tax=Laspinema olomoucense TaxID=3231600 RepID=UPI0021BAF903|nr:MULTISPECIES: hypothetical protein [unclassified Laspinema]MCT7990645.1 hypothetical protein [Laspinema sp. D3a]MCT7994657.1 hypothetical protein [Laspinema sp. D3c]